MPLIGIGLPELILILGLTVIVVGPERLPEVAAQLAKWLRQARSYAAYVQKDFNAVIGELEKEMGASREDIEEIRRAIRKETTEASKELEKAGADFKEAADLEGAVGTNRIEVGGSAANGSTNGATDSTAAKEAAMATEQAADEFEAAPATPADAKDQEWFVPTSSRRRRRTGDEGS